MRTSTLLMGIGVGASLAFVLDPARGARRRALARDRMTWLTRKTRDGIDATAHDFAHRATGIAAEASRWFSHEEVDDFRLVERVRAKLGRVCSHARAIDVHALDGEVTLRGPVLTSKHQNVLSAVSGVRGVCGVVDELQPHESPEGIPALQGGSHVAGTRIDLLQRRWAPATRALVGVAAVAAASAAMSSRRRR